MKKFKCFIITLITFIFINLIIYNLPTKVEAQSQKMYNLICFVSFNDENENINSLVNTTETKLDIIENTYNGDTYSFKDYYKSVSSSKLDLESVYLFPNSTGFESFKLSGNREVYCQKTSENPNGYDNATQASYLLVDDFTNKIQQAINNNILPCAYNDRSKTIPYSSLDSNNDGCIDSITILYSPQTQTNLKVSRDQPLYPCMAETYKISIKVGNKTITSKSYDQWVPDYSIFYHTLNSTKNFLPFGTGAHEMGHVLGYKDLYDYSFTYNPVGNMSLMSNLTNPVPQFLSGYEREIKGWVNENNISTITKSGSYELDATSSSTQSGISLYKIPIYSVKNMWVYIEYRAFNDPTINKYDNKYKDLYNGDTKVVLNGASSKNGVVIYLVNKDALYPTNYYGSPKTFGMEVLGNDEVTYKNRSDAPRVKGDSVLVSCYNSNGVAVSCDINIEVIDIQGSKAKIKITSNTLDNYELIDSDDINNDLLYNKIKSYNSIVSSSSLDDISMINFSSCEVQDLSFLNLFDFKNIKYLVLFDNKIKDPSVLMDFIKKHPNVKIILDKNNINLDKLDSNTLNCNNIFYGMQNVSNASNKIKYHLNSSFSVSSFQDTYTIENGNTVSLKGTGLNILTLSCNKYHIKNYYLFDNVNTLIVEYDLDLSNNFVLTSNNETHHIGESFNIPYLSNIDVNTLNIKISLDNNETDLGINSLLKFNTTGSHNMVIVAENDNNYYELYYNFNIEGEPIPLDISLNGESIINLEYPDNYNELGVNYNSNLALSVTITKNDILVLEIKDLGTYIITYKVTDESGNSNSITRTVIVEDTTKPIITLNNNQYYNGLEYTEFGIDYSDNQTPSQDLILTIKYYDTFNRELQNIDNCYEFTVLYEVKDLSGNVSTITRYVTLYELSILDNVLNNEDLTITIKYYDINNNEITDYKNLEEYYIEYTLLDKYQNTKIVKKQCYNDNIPSISETIPPQESSTISNDAINTENQSKSIDTYIIVIIIVVIIASIFGFSFMIIMVKKNIEK